MKASLLIIDSFGIGELPDAASYADAGSNTAVHIANAVGKVSWPTLATLGLGRCAELLGNSIPGCETQAPPRASFGVMAEVSPGKDTTTGHWELAGIQLESAFPVFPPGPPSFPVDLIRRLESVSGLRFLGNKAASGTEIIQELGDEHRRTKRPILYTSSDSVVQIAAHTEVLSEPQLYELCRLAREICDDYNVGRVIARPFEGTSGEYVRTPGRHDYSIALPGPSILNHLRSNGVETIGVGKIGDIFNQQGLSASFPDKGNPACLNRTLELVRTAADRSFVFVNLVDTDMIYGHRRDPQGYHDSVRDTDAVLARLIEQMADDDLLMISADHGCDPTFRGSDHTREYVPILAYSRSIAARNLGIRRTFADVAQTLASFFGIPAWKCGTSFF